jgi:DNA-directed RNA polymerase-3 subunit RPC5
MEEFQDLPIRQQYSMSTLIPGNPEPEPAVKLETKPVLEQDDKPNDKPAAAMADTEAKSTAKKDELDPIAEFPVFIKPHLDGDKQIFILQFPNRDRSKPYDAKHGCAPIELRVKPKAGMVELDVPLDVHRNYDRTKGIKWGEAMKKSTTAKGGGSHGLPGGFGIGGAPTVGRGRGRGEVEEEENQDRLLENYDKAVEDGHVLKKQTLGGQFVAKNSTSPIYMVGTFTNGMVLLLPILSQH